MFCQLFGKYLVDKKVIGQEDYRSAIERQLKTRVKLGTIAVTEGVMSEEQVEEVNELQRQQDRRFGDIAVEKGYLTQEQVRMMLEKQGNPYMQFIQALLQSGRVDVSQMNAHISSFQREKGFSDADMTALKNEDVDALIPIFAFSSKPFVTELAGLVVRNLIRFVTRDIYLGQMRHVEQLEYCHLAGQHVIGDYDVYLALAEEQESGGFVALASAFAKEDFQEISADVYDAVCEFVNCNSGLFASEVSNKGINMELEPALAYEKQMVEGKIYALPVHIKNYTLQLLIAVDSRVALGCTPFELKAEPLACGENAGNSGRTVLVIDDSKMSRKMLRAILEEEGYVVIAEAADGEEGLEAYKQFHPAMVTMDITMPGMDGIVALREIMDYDRDARVVMITAAGQQQKIIEALKLGAERFITKPFEKAEVAAMLKAMQKS
ncbi:MAG: response regulator [bacterium]|nr:response regulator [bacterium]MCM1374340.1 response regulator [Muribaculum sp.]